jgi:predicted transcriptional regulator of viral defense system
MNYTQTLREFCKQNQGKIFDVQYEQNHRFSLIPYKTLLKILNRLEDEKIVSSIAKGVYVVNSVETLDVDQAIKEYYIDSFSGMFIGKTMYNYYDIGDQDVDCVEIYTNKIISNNKSIDKYQLIKFETYFYDEVVSLITALELIEKVTAIMDIDYIRYNEEKEYGANAYSDAIFKEIIKHHKYKYSTIATLDGLLSKLSIENNALNIYKENFKNAFQK